MICNCEGCERKRLGLGGYQPCLNKEPKFSWETPTPPPTFEYAYKKSDSLIHFSFLPILIFLLSVGMAIGKYIL